FNVITNEAGTPHAVLIRAVEPVEGMDMMLLRTKKNIAKRNLTGGPGALTKALGINLQHNGLDLTTSKEIWIEDRGVKITKNKIIASTRVGVEYAGEHAALPYRLTGRAGR